MTKVKVNKAMIEELVLDKGLTRKELSARLGINPNQVMKMMKALNLTGLRSRKTDFEIEEEPVATDAVVEQFTEVEQQPTLL